MRVGDCQVHNSGLLCLFGTAGCISESPHAFLGLQAAVVGAPNVPLGLQIA